MEKERYSIMFSSVTGNTRMLAEAIRETLPKENCDYFGVCGGAEAKSELLYVGFWTDKGNADEDTLALLAGLRGKKIFLFGTAGFGGSEAYFHRILKNVQKSLGRSNKIIGTFMCQGKMPMSVRNRYESMKKNPIHMPNLDEMIENFDKALSHPDAADLDRLVAAAKQS